MTGDGTAEARRPGRALRAWWAASAGALALLVVTGLTNGEPRSLLWYAGTVALGVALVSGAGTRVGRVAGTWLLSAALGVTTLLAILAGFDVWNPWGPAPRVELFAWHPNLLAASLVATTGALLAVCARRRGWERVWAFALPLVALAVLVTGSRAGLAALALAWVVWLAALARGRTAWLLTLAALALLAGVVGLARWQAAREAANPNLLRSSVDLTGPTWRTAEGAQVSVEPDAAPGPDRGSRAVRVTARTSEGRLALRHVGLGRSEAGTPYVASVHLRADTPQRLELATNLSRTGCDVGPRWSRCATPVGAGDGSTYVQFRLEAAEPGGAFDVLAYGPQLERAETSSAYAPTGTGLLGVALLRRLNLGDVLDGDPRRAAAAGVAWRAFASSPWTGVGRERVRTALREADPALDVAHLAHVHNLWLQRLAAEGLLGLAAWVALFGPPLVGAFRRAGRAVAPLTAALLVLSVADMTLFFTGVIVPVWFALGAAWRAPRADGGRGRPGGGSPAQGSVGGW
jgi:hypothetical protein